LILQELRGDCQFDRHKLLNDSAKTGRIPVWSGDSLSKSKQQTLVRNRILQFRSIIFAATAIFFLGANAVAGQCNAKGGEYSLFNAAKGVWYTNSSDGCAFVAVKWGMATDKIVPADYDGDGSIDAAVWRPSNATWLIRRSSDGKAQIVKFGEVGDVPVAGDYDGDGKAEIAVWRPSVGEWLICSQKTSF